METTKLNKRDHEHIVRAAAFTRKYFPWFVKILGLFIKD